MNPANYAVMMDPKTMSYWMNPGACMHAMHMGSYMQMMDPNAYGQFMNPGVYMQWMNPTAYAMPAAAQGAQGVNMFDPSTWAKMMGQAAPAPKAQAHARPKSEPAQ